MHLSRRNVLRRIGTAAGAAAVFPSLAKAPLTASSGSIWRTGTDRFGTAVRLHNNENAYGPSPSVIAAMQEAMGALACRYPEQESNALRTRIAELHGVAPERVVLGCGSSEILRMTADTFLGPGRELIVAQPTFELISEYARRAGAIVKPVALTKEHSHDLNAMGKLTGNSTGLVYICNPNNPTGTVTRRQAIEAFLRTIPDRTRVLIDEAYHHYAGASADYGSLLDHPIDDERVIVTRSFSSIYGLAGLRVGYAVAGAETARRLGSSQLSDSVNGLAARAAVIALGDTAHVAMSTTRNADDRQEFFNQANARMLRAIDSQTNFVMLGTARPAVEIVEHCHKHQVLVFGPIPSYGQHIRVTLGTPAEMQEFWRVWDLMPGHTM